MRNKLRGEMDALEKSCDETMEAAKGRNQEFQAVILNIKKKTT